MASHNYDASDIDVLELDIERVQAQPQIYIPDKKMRGAIHLIREIKDNADDEALVPEVKDKKVIVTYDEVTRVISVSDHGRGMPFEKLRELCEVLNSSGKFNKGDNSAYKFAGGMHGVGLKITNFLSEYLKITTTRDGRSVTRYYNEGIFDKEEESKASKNKHGTTVEFVISTKYLKDVDKIRCKHVQQMIEEKADACPGLTTEFHGITKDGKEINKTYVGLTTNELINKYNKLTSKVWEFEDATKNDELRVRIAFGYDAKETEGCNLMGWTNYIYNKDGGTHIDAIVDSLYDFFSKYMKKNYLSEKDKKNLQIKKEDIRLGLCSVVVLLAVDPEFHGQYKEAMISDTIKNELMLIMKKKLSKLSDGDIRIICGIIKDNVKARMSSQRARQQVKKVGNGISKDRIQKYIPAKMGCTTKYRELYITEGESAGDGVEQARLDFQEVYKLRGKTDNIYDMDMNTLSKKDIIQDLSRIIGLIPGKKGIINQDRICCLSDADPDGLAIRAGVVLIFAMAFPQVIDEGRLYMIEPPLFGFIDNNGDRVFKSTNREYITYLQEQFVKNNKVYYKGNKIKSDALTEFLLRNERYLEYLKNVSDKNVCSPYFTELIISNIYDLGIDKSSVKSWDKLIKKKFSHQLSATWEDDRIIISGIKDGNYEMMELDDELLNSKRTKRLINIMNQNMNQIYGYSLTGNDESDSLSISELLGIFSKYKAKSLHRFKGLGEMSAKELRDTCMDLNNQRSVRIVWKDVDKSIAALADWHSKKEKYRAKRKDFMLQYIPDIQEIST